MYGQTPAQWWAAASQEQKDFARECYDFGKQYGRGHTLAAIAWMESSLGKDLEHDESSWGPFGISSVTANSYERRGGREGDTSHEFSSAAATRGFIREANLVLQIFEDNVRYFRRLGYNPREAYFWAYPRYCAGSKWRRFKRRGEIFNARIRFLREIFE